MVLPDEPARNPDLYTRNNVVPYVSRGWRHQNQALFQQLKELIDTRLFTVTGLNASLKLAINAAGAVTGVLHEETAPFMQFEEVKGRKVQKLFTDMALMSARHGLRDSAFDMFFIEYDADKNIVMVFECTDMNMVTMSVPESIGGSEYEQHDGDTHTVSVLFNCKTTVGVEAERRAFAYLVDSVNPGGLNPDMLADPTQGASVE